MYSKLLDRLVVARKSYSLMFLGLDQIDSYVLHLNCCAAGCDGY